MVCVDDYSNLTMVYFLNNKGDSVQGMQKLIADVRPYGSIKSIRTDGGGEFISKDFEKLLLDNGIRHEMSAPYSPHQNGTAERAWRTLFEMSRCLLLQSQLSKSLWTYATMFSAYIRNRCYNHRIKCTPYQMFLERKPNLSKIYPFGTKCFALNQNPKKLDDRCTQGIFIGFDKGSPAHLVYFPDKEIVKKIRTVKSTPFNDSEPKAKNESTKNNQDFNSADLDDAFDDIVHLRNRSEKNVSNSSPHGFERNVESDTGVDTDPVPNDDNNALGSTTDNESRSKRQRSRPKHLNDFYLDDEINDHLNLNVHYCYNVTNCPLPMSYTDAVSSKDSSKWMKAMKDEMSALRENQTFEITPLPEDRSAIGSRWVYTIKNGPNGEPQHKARFVAKGYSQMPGIDFDETFSPTARITSVRTMLQIAVQNGLTVHQMDVKSAYLNAPIDCELFVQQPEGFEVESEANEKLVLKLNKSLYGLKQSGRNWNNLLHAFLTEQGFSQSQVDPCVYTMNSNNLLTVILCYVDDILLMSNSNDILTQIKRKLNEKFMMKDLGRISYFLGIEFSHDKEIITMHQKSYLNKLLCRFNMQNCKPKFTPSEMNINKFENEDVEDADARLYREIVGGLIYAMTCSRPDLSFIVTKLSQHMSKPNKHHMTMAKHTLRYIKATIDRQLIFRKSENRLNLTGFCDSDWANSEDRKSVSGYCFQLTQDGPLISWKSKKQTTVALSTCEAEYISLSSATQEGIFLLSLLNDISPSNLMNFELKCDNQSAIAVAKNPIQSQRTKHIDIKYHFLRDMVQTGRVQVIYVPSESNVADALTKPMTRLKIERFKCMAMG